MGQQVFFALASFLIIGSVFHGSEGYAKSPSPRTSVLSPVGGRTPSFGFNGKPPRSNAWSPTSPVKGSVPLLIQGLAAIVPEHSLSRYIHKDDKRSKWISPTIDNHIPQSPIGEDPPLQPVSISPSVNDKRYGMPTAAPPVEIVNHLSPSYHSPTKGSPPVMPIAPHVGLKSPENSSPASGPVPKLRATEGIHSPAPATLSPPSIIFHTHRRKKRTSIPASSPLNAIPPPPYQQDPPLHPVSISPSVNDKRNGMPIASPPVEIVNHLSPSYHSPTEGLKSPNNSSPASSPVTKLRATEGIHSPAPAPLSPPSIIFHMHKRKKRTSIPASAPLNAIPPPYQQDPPLQPVAISPSVNDKRYGMPTAAPPVEIVNHLSPSYYSPTKGSPPVMPIAPHVGLKSPVNSSPASGPVPKLRATEGVHSPAPPPPLIFHSHQRKKRISSPASAPLNVIPPPYQQDPPLHPVSISPSVNDKRNGMPIASPPVEIVNHLSPSYHSPTKGPVDYPQSPSHPPTVLPKKSRQRYHGYPPIVQGPSTSAIEPPFFPTVKEGVPAPSPSVTIPSRPTQRAPSPSLTVQGPPRLIQGPSLSTVQPPFSPTVKQGMPAPSPLVTIHFRPTERAPSPSIAARYGPTKGAPSPSLRIPSRPIERPILSPEISPSIFPMTRKMPVAAPVRALPPPPPNQDCLSLTCMEPLTNTPPGSPCACVLPMQVGLRLSVALYTFFPLVSELAQEIATAIFMKQSQVRIMGANAASQEPDKTIVLINLVPLGQKFDNTTAFLTYEKFWHKQVPINTSFFGDYEVLYIHYPGLPPSPPSAPSSITVTGEQLPNGNNGRTIQPLGVDVMKRKERLGISLIAIIVLSSAIALVLCAGTMWLLLWKCGRRSHQPSPSPRASAPLPKPSGPGSVAVGSWPSSAASASISFSSSIAAYTGTAKTFSIGEIEKATDNFDASRILGEGGFGCVYRGILEDGTRVAVKVLKRDDQQGSREFLAEVEMLGRLHHRNLVKLIGICTEEHSRCLVYELIPNGSVESHLHGVDKEMAPLDWSARMKIALGSARGLAYLHEDSNPRVIHRDFKSSNILLEYDFTPKVSDFGLARTALDGRNDHISTRVMGTFGYVAPEYAMTGHLLVKSDVYSYGVVLLELLTGRKPVDMSQPAGQENLVAWARPLLTSKEGLEMIIDPALGSNFPFDSVAKVAAIASMCVQREVSNRPFMGEVVQALKLVCNENDEKQGESGSFSHEGSSVQDVEIQVSNASGQLPVARSFLTADYDSGLETERALSTSATFSRQESQYFTRHSSSGPLKIGNYVQSWQGGVPGGSVSEHGSALKLWEVLDNKERWP